MESSFKTFPGVQNMPSFSLFKLLIHIYFETHGLIFSRFEILSAQYLVKPSYDIIKLTKSSNLL